MSISLCMIVKDEEKLLEQCLNSVKDIVDEIIIVDTGSKDKTKEIAKKFTKNVLDFEWKNDFSEARNFSIEKATKDWIMFLDADDVIAKEDHKDIKELVEKAEEDMGAFSFIERNYSNNSFLINWMNVGEEDKYAKEFAGFCPNIVFKLFRNNKGIKFDGKVHETVIKSIEEKGLKVVSTKIPIHHYKEEKGSQEQKRENYLELVEEKLKKNPEDMQALFEAGQMYLDNNYTGKAITSFEKITKTAPNYDVLILLGISYERLGVNKKAENSFNEAIKINPDTESAFIQLSSLYIKTNKTEEAIEILEKLIKRKSTNIIVCNNLGIAYLNGDKIQEAVTVLRQGVNMDKKSRSQVSVMIHNNFFDALLRLGKREEAEKMMEEAISLNPSVKSYYQNFASYYTQIKQAEKAKDILSKGQKYFSDLK